MSAHHPDYWLVYMSDSEHAAPGEVTAIAPAILDRPRFGPDARWLLAATDSYRDAHPHHRVVFAAAVTRWLRLTHGKTWDDVGVHFHDALADLDEHSPALLMTCSDIVTAVVANAAVHLTVLVPGQRDPITDISTEEVRALLLDVLERDWPPYIARRLAEAAKQ